MSMNADLTLQNIRPFRAQTYTELPPKEGDHLMSATETFQSLDDTMKRVREAYEAEIKAVKDQLLAAQIELEMWKTRGRDAILDRDAHMRVSTKLITQFGMVEKVFAEAKALALTHFADLEKEAKDAVQTVLTKVEGAQ